MQEIPTRFIGVDLARKDTHHTGIAVARAAGSGAILEAVSSDIASLKGAVEFVVSHARRNAVVAVDAPLIVTNERGQRACETEIGRRFGRYEASAHTTNLQLYPDPSGVRFRRALEDAGFVHTANPASLRASRGRALFEVYTHTAQVVLFGLDKTLKYRKRPLARRRAAFDDYHRHLLGCCSRLGLGIPANLKWLFHLAVEKMTGQRLKRHEDTLDAVFCALLAFHCWRFGDSANESIGDATGYIINPTPARPLSSATAARRLGPFR